MSMGWELQRDPVSARTARAVRPCVPAGPEAAVMRLQRAAGNRAAVQLVARSRSQLGERVLARDPLDELEKDDAARAGRFDDPMVQAVYDRHASGTERQRLALGILDFPPAAPPAGKWRHLAWKDIAADAAERVFDAAAFDQASLDVCGTAATLNVAVRIDPVQYARLVVECYSRGTVDDSEFNSELLGTTPQPGMAVVDWMLMSAMQSRANDSYTFNGRPGGHAGTTFKQDRWELKAFAGAVETDTIDAEDDQDVIPATKQVNALLSSHPGEIEVLISINSAVMTNPTVVSHGHDHVVALTRPATITEDWGPVVHAPPPGLLPGPNPEAEPVLAPVGAAYRGTVSADLFTWGKILHWSGSVAQWQRMVHAFIVGSTRKGLL
jgi:hypothetical protein